MNTNQNPTLLLEEAFNQIGASMMNDDFACKLLAWLFVIGGNTELSVTHSGSKYWHSPCSKEIKAIWRRSSKQGTFRFTSTKDKGIRKHKGKYSMVD